jgi:integrase
MAKKGKGNISTKVNFTHGRVNGFTCPAGKKNAFLWDLGVYGLGLRATAGSKSYIFQARLPGATGPFRMVIGSANAITLNSARNIARNLAVKVAKGIDPREERREQAKAAVLAAEQANRKMVTVADAWSAYLKAAKGRKQRKWSARHLADHEYMMRPPGIPAKRGPKGTNLTTGPLWELSSLKLTELTTVAVKAWLDKEAAKRPASARLSFRLLKAFIRWCDSQAAYKGLVNLDAVGQAVAKAALPPAQVRDDVLQKEQLSAWFGAVRKLNPVISAYLQALLLTGARRNEMAPLKWADVDFTWRSLTIHDKVDGERTIPLTPYLATLLYPLPRNTQYVFASPTAACGYLAEPRHAHNRATATAGIEGLTIHGLRRSFASLSEWVEVPTGIVAQIMGHRPSATAERHYKRRPLDLLRLWHTKIEKWILNEAGIQQPAEDAELGRLRAVK